MWEKQLCYRVLWVEHLLEDVYTSQLVFVGAPEIFLICWSLASISRRFRFFARFSSSSRTILHTVNGWWMNGLLNCVWFLRHAFCQSARGNVAQKSAKSNKTESFRSVRVRTWKPSQVELHAKCFSQFVGNSKPRSTPVANNCLS